MGVVPFRPLLPPSTTTSHHESPAGKPASHLAYSAHHHSRIALQPGYRPQSRTHPFLTRVPLIFIAAQYIVGTFACIGGGLFGLDISSMSGVLSVSFPAPYSPTFSPSRLQNEAYLRVFHHVCPFPCPIPLCPDPFPPLARFKCPRCYRRRHARWFSRRRSRRHLPR